MKADINTMNLFYKIWNKTPSRLLPLKLLTKNTLTLNVSAYKIQLNSKQANLAAINLTCKLLEWVRLITIWTSKRNQRLFRHGYQVWFQWVRNNSISQLQRQRVKCRFFPMAKFKTKDRPSSQSMSRIKGSLQINSVTRNKWIL